MGERKTVEQFVAEAREVHGDKYDYDLVDYRKRDVKVIITCEVHGYFEQRPLHHLAGNGCPECAADNKRKPLEDFVKESRQVHGGKYEYNQVNYRRRDKKIVLVCPVHGKFTQLPQDHLTGSGCAHCSGNAKKE